MVIWLVPIFFKCFMPFNIIFIIDKIYQNINLINLIFHFSGIILILSLNQKNARRLSNMKNKLHISGELALALAVVLNSFGVVLMLYSGSGISAISSVPYAFSETFPFFTLGTWTYIFQGLLILSLMILRRQFVPSYLFSFAVGFGFSICLDIHEAWIEILPTDLLFRICYFLISYILISVGIAISNRCLLPIIPTDLFPRELAVITRLPYARVKIGFDFFLSWTYRRAGDRNHRRGFYHGKSRSYSRPMAG